MNSPYLSYKSYMQERYGQPLFRIPIDFNSGCPNRAPDGSGGCTFCNARGAAAVQILGAETVEQQLAQAIRFARDRYRAKKYMAYIQAFSATFEPEQQQKYRALLDAHDFAAVSIGTRPDCLPPAAYTFLSELNEQIETWVELGVQTIHDQTLKRINRGHNWGASEHAINQLHQHGIKVAVHVILGLPGETAVDFQQTADTLATLPIDAIKIHNLHIEKGTALAKEYLHSHHGNAETQSSKLSASESSSKTGGKNNIPLFMEHDFAERLMDFIRRMPPHIPIMRLTTDSLDTELIAPRWHMAKGQFKDYVIQQMTCREWKQGDLHTKVPPASCRPRTPLKSVETEDGSTTFWNEDYKEHYHSPAGARLEATEKYLVPGHLKERLAQGEVHLLDVCFGLGYNSLAALNLTTNETKSLQITALEMDRRVVGAAAQNIQPAKTDTFDWRKTLTELYRHEKSCITEHALINIVWGDARYTITQIESAAYDLIFLDAFSTQRNSELWTVDFFKQLKRVMKPDAVLLTYCAAIPVRAGFMEAGFFVGETQPIGRQRGGTIATLKAENIQIPLPDHELKMIQETTRGLPYRDPYSVWTNKEILRDRQERILEYASICSPS